MSQGKPRGRSPEAKKRRAATRNRVIEAAKKQSRAIPVFEPPLEPGELCRRCFKRPHVPLHDLCRACRYYARNEGKS